MKMESIKTGDYVSSTFDAVTKNRKFIEGFVISIEFNIAKIRTQYGIKSENLLHLKKDTENAPNY